MSDTYVEENNEHAKCVSMQPAGVWEEHPYGFPL